MSQDPAIAVGVDVVDLTAARAAGRSTDERFLKRVFSNTEQVRIAAAPDPDLEVWRLWASKEAAFKVVSKLVDPIPVFRHVAVEIELAGPTSDYGDPTFAGVARFQGHEVEVRGSFDPAGYVMASARNPHPVGYPDISSVGRLDSQLDRWGISPDEWQPRVRELLTPGELEPVHGLASALARLNAREAAAVFLGLPVSRLQILSPPGHTGLRPPYLHLDGERMKGADVSLTHDGPWIGWAVRGRPEG